jgi:hypothetical protein
MLGLRSRLAAYNNGCCWFSWAGALGKLGSLSGQILGVVRWFFSLCVVASCSVASLGSPSEPAVGRLPHQARHNWHSSCLQVLAAGRDACVCPSAGEAQRQAVRGDCCLLPTTKQGLCWVFAWGLVGSALAAWSGACWFLRHLAWRVLWRERHEAEGLLAYVVLA